MSTSVISSMTQLDTALDMLRADLALYENKAEESMLIMERMSTRKSEYTSACRQLMINSFAIKLIKRVIDVVETGDLKSSESFIRFHAHYLRLKGSVSSGDINLAQCLVAVALESIIDNVFNN